MVYVGRYTMGWVGGDRLTEPLILGLLITIAKEIKAALSHSDRDAALKNVLDAREVQIASLNDVVGVCMPQ